MCVCVYTRAYTGMRVESMILSYFNFFKILKLMSYVLLTLVYYRIHKS